jgi:signal transduction histidine kinase
MSRPARPAAFRRLKPSSAFLQARREFSSPWVQHLPFAIAFAAVLVVAGGIAPHLLVDPWVVIATAVTVGVTIAVRYVPWESLPPVTIILLPLLDVVAIAMLREGAGATIGTIGLLLFFPAFWFATEFHLIGVAISTACAASVMLLPSWLGEEEINTSQNLARVLLVPTIIAIKGVVVNFLAGRIVRQREGLESLTTRLRDSLSERDEFVATVSHELRTPLTSIRGYVDLLRDEAPLEMQPQLDVIDRNVGRLQLTVDDLLQSAGRDLVLQPIPCDLAEIADGALRSIQPRARGKNITLLSSIPESLSVTVDAARIDQVLDNLLSNAIKYTPEGGMVSVGLRRQDDRAVITVTDTGIGIAADEQGQLFTRFFRASSARESGSKGLGLGLSIVRSVVQAHGGDIALESELGKGTTVSVTIPLGE